MTAQYHEGQEVEVFKIITPPAYGRWRKATIIYETKVMHEDTAYAIVFSDGTRAVFNADYIRPVEQGRMNYDSII